MSRMKRWTAGGIGAPPVNAASQASSPMSSRAAAPVSPCDWTALQSFSHTRGTAAKNAGRTSVRYAPICAGSGHVVTCAPAATWR